MVVEFLTQLHVVLKAYFGDVKASFRCERTSRETDRAAARRASSGEEHQRDVVPSSQLRPSPLFSSPFTSEHHVTLYQPGRDARQRHPREHAPRRVEGAGASPNLLNRAQSVVFGHQGVLVSDQDPLKLLPLPWRSNNIKYASNEIYLDVIESIDATLDAEGGRAELAPSTAPSR